MPAEGRLAGQGALCPGRFKRGGLLRDPMAEMRLTVTHTGKGHEVQCQTPEGATITFDGDGGTFGGTPMQHLLGAIAACALMDVHVILAKKRLKFANLRAECVASREKVDQVNPFTGVKLVFRVEGEVPAKAFEDAVKLSVEKYCSVGATLARPTPIVHEAHVTPK